MIMKKSLTVNIIKMEKKVEKMVVLAVLACVMLSSCTKEENDSLVNNTPTDASLWPEGALMTGGDDYYYMGNQRQELNRSESMLYICFSPASYINNLPNNFAVLYPIETSRPDSKGAVVLFSGIDRQTAIEQELALAIVLRETFVPIPMRYSLSMWPRKEHSMSRRLDRLVS